MKVLPHNVAPFKILTSSFDLVSSDQYGEEGPASAVPPITETISSPIEQQGATHSHLTPGEGAARSYHINRIPASSFRPCLDYTLGWISVTFVDGEQAEMALCADRALFVRRFDIMELIPRDIRLNILHTGDNAQIRGFSELFVHLEVIGRPATNLRDRVVTYFEESPVLRPYLSQSFLLCVLKSLL